MQTPFPGRAPLSELLSGAPEEGPARVPPPGCVRRYGVLRGFWEDADRRPA